MRLERNALVNIMGMEELGRVTFIKQLVNYVDTNKDVMPTKIYIVDDVNRELESLKELDSVIKYTKSIQDATSYLAELYNEVGTRYNEMAENPDMIDSKPLVLLIINSTHVADVFASDPQAMKMYDVITNKFKGYRACIMHTNVENATITYKSNDILKHISEYASHLIFIDANQIKTIELPLRYVRENSKKLDVSEAFYIENGTICKIKTVVQK